MRERHITDWLTHLRIEDRLILFACGQSSRVPGLLADAAETIDWELLVSTAVRNRVEVTVGRVLMPQPELPERWRAKFRVLLLKAMRSADEMPRTLERMLPAAMHGNDVVLLRGAAYALTTYRTRTVRDLGDIDVFIDRPRHHSVSGVLNEHWHVPQAVRDAAPGVGIEYHHNLNTVGGWGLPLARMDIAAMRARQRRVQVGAYDVGVLENEDALLYLSYHNVGKGFVRLYRFVDMLHLIRAGPIDWDVVTGRARAAGLSRVVWMNLRVLDALDPDLIPAAVLSALAPSALIRRVVERSFDPNLLLHDPNPVLGPPDANRWLHWRKQLFLRLLLVRWDNAHTLLITGIVTRLMIAYTALFRMRGIGTALTRLRPRVQSRRKDS